MPENFQFQLQEIFADVASRTISGIVVPTGETTEKAGRTWRFNQGSATYPEKSPLLGYHDQSKPLGRHLASGWEPRGLRASFRVSKTVAGDEVLQLANDGVLGFSIGIDNVEGQQVGEEFVVSKSVIKETSLTPTPAFTGATVDSVSMSQGGTMPDPTPPSGQGAPAAPTTTGPPAPTTGPPAPSITFDDGTLKRLGEALATAFATPQPPTTATAPAAPTPAPTAVPVAPPVASVKEPAPYRFDGHAAQYGFVSDALASLREHDGEASARLTKFFAETFVDSSDVAAQNVPPNRPEMWVGPLTWGSRPLGAAISTGSIDNATPFIFPKFVSSGSLTNDHVEGVEPDATATYTSESQTVTPSAIDGKAALTRIVLDAGGSPQVDALVWAEMTNDYGEKLETRVATMLDAVDSDLDVEITGVDAVAVDAADSAIVDLQYEKGGSRFRSFVLASDLYKALAGARDGDGRALIPAIAPSNADGTRDPAFASLSIGGFRAVPAYALGAEDSFMLVKTSVWQWSSAPRKLTLDYEVANVYLGLFGYEAHAITRDSDVRRWTYAAS
jgi:hypothetical protein